MAVARRCLVLLAAAAVTSASAYGAHAAGSGSGSVTIGSRAAAHAAQSRHHVRAVYFDSQRHIFRAPASRPSHRRRLALPHHDVVVEQAVVSPNGRLIAEELGDFTTLKRNVGCSGACDRIAVARADGRHAHWVYTLPAKAFRLGRLAWAPDSKSLYFSVERFRADGYEGHLMAVPADGASHAAPVAGGAGLIDPAVSPGGTMLAAVRPNFGRQGLSHKSSLVGFDLASGEVTRTLLRSDLGPGERFAAIQEPQFSPNGKRVVVVVAKPADGPQDNERSVIDVIAADGSGHGHALRIASGRHVRFLHDPFWRTNRTIWFSRNFKSFGNTDVERHSTPAELFSVRVHGRAAAKPKRLTRTKRVDERDPTFAT